MNQFGSPWTPEREAILREMAETKKYSAAQIADEVGGGITRCAVVGKARREGIALRPHNSKWNAPRKPRAPKATPVLKFKEPVEAAIDLPPDESPFACTIIELESGMCRYPFGTPGTPEFRYCGAPDCEGSYCDRHFRLTHYTAKTLTDEDKARRAAYYRKMNPMSVIEMKAVDKGTNPADAAIA